MSDMESHRVMDIGSVFVLPGKDLLGIDLIWCPDSGKARSLRSNAEMINELKKAKVPREEIERVLGFIFSQLQQIQKDIENVCIQALDWEETVK